ncbi:L-idonate 5-dehydrogenase [Nitratireductor rhodophyticola]|uniref:L-idonate 5-dehydrogenase n=1 Tax=Nitratireductor rhodophyticola TaxID=2854036 RepID=UPI0032D94246
METRVCRLYDKHDLRVETETIAEPAHDQVLVAIGAGGICGSDLHYFHDGGFGPIRIREPIILGHEVAGTVLAVGPDVTGLDAGDRVAINPSRPCHTCKYCLEGLFNHCLNMRFYGSAIRFPHEQGAFRDRIISEAFRCEKIRPSTSLAEAACAEPLAVCLHARSQAGTLKGKRVLITGAGPIGALCAAVAKEDGAAEIVITDLQEKPLAVARRMGATSTINVARDSAPMSAYTAEKGYFDVAFECSAAGPAIRMAIECVRPCGIIVQVGVTGDIALPINAIAAKEITLRGTHRFHAEYSRAVRLIDSGKIDVRPVITDTFPLEMAQAAFETAGDRTRSVKVQLTFE